MICLICLVHIWDSFFFSVFGAAAHSAAELVGRRPPPAARRIHYQRERLVVTDRLMRVPNKPVPPAGAGVAERVDNFCTVENDRAVVRGSV